MQDSVSNLSHHRIDAPPKNMQQGNANIGIGA